MAMKCGYLLNVNTFESKILLRILGPVGLYDNVLWRTKLSHNYTMSILRYLYQNLLSIIAEMGQSYSMG